MDKKLFRLYGLLAGLIVLAACAPQTLPPTPPLGTDEGLSKEATTPIMEPTAPPAGATSAPETLHPPAYPAENQAETGKEVVRGLVELAESKVVVTKNPLRVELNVAGNLPTPCHQLAWEIEPASKGSIQIELFSEVDPEVICVQVLEPFDERIELIRLLPGDYTVWVNGEQVSEFQLDARAGYP